MLKSRPNNPKQQQQQQQQQQKKWNYSKRFINYYD